MTGADFLTLQGYLIDAYWPFIRIGIFMFLAASILISLLIIFLVISRRVLARFA